MRLTDDVLKLFKFNDIKELHPRNILSIRVTDDASKEDKSIYIIFDKPKNMQLQLVALVFHIIVTLLIFFDK